MQLQCLCLVILIQKVVTDGTEFRIINGEETSIEAFPFLVLLAINGEQSCGGSIISSTLVLTAAHCVIDDPDPSIYTVHVGANKADGSDGFIYKVAKVIYHNEYSREILWNDIALLKIKGVFHFNARIQQVALARNDSAVRIGMLCDIAGWGETDKGGLASTLRTAHVPIFDHAECQTEYGKEDMKIIESMLCAGFEEGGIDTCQGDSGGPLLYNHVQIGIVSFGYGCAQPGFPGVYTDVRMFNEWLRDAIDDME